MFSFLQKRPRRGIVFKIGEDDKFRWRAVEIDEIKLRDRQTADSKDCRTCFTDTIQDGYFNVRDCFQDALREIERWCPRNKVSWWLEDNATGILLRCHLVGDAIRLPNQEAAAQPSNVD